MPYFKDPKMAGVMDTRIKFAGRTVYLTVCVNTDEDIGEVAERVNDAAKGPKLRMAFTGVKLVTGPDAISLWMEMQKVLKNAGAEQAPGGE